MKWDWIVLVFAVVVLLLGFVGRRIWFDWFMGALLVWGGITFLLMGFGALPRSRSKPTAIPYPILGAIMTIQGIALGIFHVRF